MWREIKRIIESNHSFLITTHVNPDGDGIGAATALVELLLQLGKRVRFVSDGPIPEKFSFLDYHKLFSTFSNELFLDPQVVIVLDTHQKERIGRLSGFLEKEGIVSICIDHHSPKELFTPFIAIDPKACSVGAMVYTLIKEFGHELNYEAASGIYTSILCDTGRFSYSSTSRKAHKIADECIKLGVDPNAMYGKLFQRVPLAQVKIFAKALQRMETFFNDRVLVLEIKKQDCQGGELELLEHLDLEYILEFNKWIEEVECVILLRELTSGVRISLRSKTKLDVGKLVLPFGGGGHSKAAGLHWEGPASEIKQKLLEQIESETLPKVSKAIN